MEQPGRSSSGRQAMWWIRRLALGGIGLVACGFFFRGGEDMTHANDAQSGGEDVATGTHQGTWTGWLEVEDGNRLDFREISVAAREICWTPDRLLMQSPSEVDIALEIEAGGRWRGRSWTMDAVPGQPDYAYQEVEVSGFRSSTRESLLVTIHRSKWLRGNATAREAVVRIYLGREVTGGATVP